MIKTQEQLLQEQKSKYNDLLKSYISTLKQILYFADTKEIPHEIAEINITTLCNEKINVLKKGLVGKNRSTNNEKV